MSVSSSCLLCVYLYFLFCCFLCFFFFCFFFFFFFQAEDGIRDPLVTGVQTCAPVKLPTSHGPRRCCRPSEDVNETRVVFHCCLPSGQNRKINGSHLCYACNVDVQWQAIVKVHG